MNEHEFWEHQFIHGLPDDCRECIYRRKCNAQSNVEYDDCQHFLQRMHYDFMYRQEQSGELDKEIYGRVIE